jgi:predicted Holliday junction resolvase-like endonuclease
MGKSAVLVVVAVAVVAVVLVLRAHYALHAHKARYRWTDDDLALARKDSLYRSHLTVTGKVQEHLAPLFPELLAEFNPRDARFLGSPVDFVVFDGLDSGEVARVVFVEVKSGRASLSGRERLVRDAVSAGRVEWRLVRLAGEGVESAGQRALG